MARVCEICGKSASIGNRVETRGKAKYLGGVGTKVTGITRRKFKPNLQRVKVATPNGGAKSMRVCTQCIRSGAIRKKVRQAPFRLPVEAKSGGAKKGKRKAAPKTKS
ncbi:MAG: 50S ribosomal protein L28 [Planctomycetes bacterium]|nr:50S ribosomal protein L28 [Planctomycetota bacterium]